MELNEGLSGSVIYGPDSDDERHRTGTSSLADSMPMMDAYISMMRASALIAAGRTGLFEALANGPLTIERLAEAVGADEAGLARLADFLVLTGHVDRQDDRFANAPRTMRWFTSWGSVDYRSGLVWTGDAWPIMDDLGEAVRNGLPSQLLWDRMEERPELGRNFARYMATFARHLAPDLLELAPLSDGPLRLLDLGGSHGLHAMAFCDRHPGVRAVIVDLESALHETAKRIGHRSLADRIELRQGDIRSCDWGQDYDIVLYLSVAHNMSREDNRAVFAHLAKTMRPGGSLIIHDYPVETTPALFLAAFRLTLLVETGTDTLGYGELAGMLSDAGFSQLSSHTLVPADKGTLILARK
ncbi:methyltransferase [Sphingomonas arantia]|uniref:Methyltransferase n=1 Tax=Sphingomonas arantia TaxID=1460676 RepID=A0ABW4U1P9_9SPHN